MTDATVLTRPKPRRRRKIDAAMRQRIEAAIEAMINTLDALEAPTEDREEDDDGGSGSSSGNEDDEPSLGSSDKTWNQTRWADGCGDRDLEHSDDDFEVCESDFEDDSHDGCEPDVDDEPSLGVPEQMDQDRAWKMAGQAVWADGEISLGMPEEASATNQKFSPGRFGCRDGREIEE